MMKHYLLYILFGLVVLPACGQGLTDYYRLPDQSPQNNRLVARYGGPSIRNRWYVALDGFMRTDRAQIDNAENGLITSDLVGKPGLGVTLGWVYRERWALEAGYARMPIHTQVSINNTTPPLGFRNTDSRSSFVVRGKRLLLSTSKPWLRSGFWVSGGMWVVPGKDQPDNHYNVQGYRYQGRWEAMESFRMVTLTKTNPEMITMAELGAEYNVRLSNALDLGINVRKFWGLGNTSSTDVVYLANRTVTQQAQFQASGTGMSYGVTLRYNFSIKRSITNVLDVQGKKQRIL
ncbi:hypothetical protein IC229_09560 [Spirosoma sp. BT702]|uniref:Uncharacterized protein n=1 Tax=Spirosoma profusum TaxID=2771354 RepID=A0A926XVA0_9BACT|nr:hypothetical protein [Spirosoma profusum]MBD2700884.1 hypothetical protein [Spirosoma profusum]